MNRPRSIGAKTAAAFLAFVSSSAALPNLTPYQPPGWSDKIVVSTVQGTTTDSPKLTTADTLYVDWAIINNGSAPTASIFDTALYVDGVFQTYWYSDPPVNPNWWQYVRDYSIGPLSAGEHTITVTVNYTGTVVESNYADNSYTKKIIVGFGRYALPPPWMDEDIGSVGTAGSASFGNGRFTVQGSGNDIWDYQDAFHFVYQAVNGDVTVFARVASQQNTDPWAKAGVMIRQSPDPGSPHAMMVVTPGNGTSFQYRINPNDLSHYVQPKDGVTAPYCVELVRVGDTFTGYKSVDGSSWVSVGSATIPRTSAVYVGLAVTAHNYGFLSTATFDEVHVIKAPPSLTAFQVLAHPLWTDLGLVVENGSLVTTTASGFWNWGTNRSAFGPDGDSNSPYPFWDLFCSKARQGALIAYVGPDPFQGHWGDSNFFPRATGYWSIGSSNQFITDRTGELWLGFNDDAVSQNNWDNSGLVTAIWPFPLRQRLLTFAPASARSPRWWMSSTT